MPRAMLVVAHPDDEVIAIGGRIRRFRWAHFVHVTDGAPLNQQDSRHQGFSTLDAYRSARRDEFRRALSECGLSRVSFDCLAFSDQEASLHLADLTRKIASLILQHSPEVVLTHPYEGGHPDHDACAFAVHQAIHQLVSRNIQPPLVAETAFYHLGPFGIETGCFLNGSKPKDEITYMLTSREQTQKQRLLRCFSTQRATLQYFSTARERFRLAPDYDFTTPPHCPPVFYDGYPWGMNSFRFCELAKEALAAMRFQREEVMGPR